MPARRAVCRRLGAGPRGVRDVEDVDRDRRASRGQVGWCGRSSLHNIIQARRFETRQRFVGVDRIGVSSLMRGIPDSMVSPTTAALTRCRDGGVVAPALALALWLCPAGLIDGGGAGVGVPAPFRGEGSSEIEEDKVHRIAFATRRWRSGAHLRVDRAKRSAWMPLRAPRFRSAV